MLPVPCLRHQRHVGGTPAAEDDRVEGRAAAVASPLGWLPASGAVELEGANVSEADWEQLFAIDPAAHLAEADDAEKFFDRFGDRVPAAVRGQLAQLRAGMGAL